MSGIIESITDFVSDLLGCESLETPEEVTKCRARAKKYATWLIFAIIIVILILVVPKVYFWYKGRSKK